MSDKELSLNEIATNYNAQDPTGMSDIDAIFQTPPAEPTSIDVGAFVAPPTEKANPTTESKPVEYDIPDNANIALNTTQYAGVQLPITTDELEELFGLIKGEDREKIIMVIINKFKKQKYDMTVANIMTPEEVDSFIKNKFIAEANAEVTKYLKEREVKINISVDKENFNNIEIPDTIKNNPSEFATKIKYTLVENVDLEAIKLKALPKSDVMPYMDKLSDKFLSTEYIALPALGEWACFKGAQIMQLASAVQKAVDDTATARLELLQMKSSLIYNQLINGTTVLHKNSKISNITMTYNEFCNTFKFHDVDLAMYAILLASSPIKQTSIADCEKCNNSYTYEYDLRELFKPDTDTTHVEFLNRYDMILNNHSDINKMKLIYEESSKSLIVKSDTTGIIFTINQPTISKMENVMKSTLSKNEIDQYASMPLSYISNIYIPDDDGAYINISDDNIPTLKQAFKNLRTEDATMVYRLIRDSMIIDVGNSFFITTKCPKCGNEGIEYIDVNQLVFLATNSERMKMFGTEDM